MLKNAIESADYYLDSCKRRHNPRCSHEKGINLPADRLWGLDYGRFSSHRTLFPSDLLQLLDKSTSGGKI